MRSEDSFSEQLSYTAAFSTSLLDPMADIPSVISGGFSQVALASRYNIYRNNVTVSLIDALAAIYPTVQRIAGADFFRAMARFHLRCSPPHSPLLFEYGRDFPAFIAEYEYARPVPWLADVARIERAWLDAYHAADAKPLPASAFTSLPQDRLADIQFKPHPATRIVKSNYSAVTLFAAYRDAQDVGEPVATAGPENALVTRPELEVTVRYLSPDHSSFLDALLSGCCLSEATNATLAAFPDFDLAASITGIIEAGAFCGVHIGEES